MVQFTQLDAASEWSTHLKNFDWKKQTWVVADLRSKFEVQQTLFSTTKVLPEVSVLRASELWQLLFKAKFPDYKIVSSSYVQALCSNWLSQEEQDWLKTPGVSTTLVAYLDHLAPCLVHKEGQEHIGSWLENQEGALVRWGKWFFLAQVYFQKLDEQKVVLPSWIPAYLVNNTDNQFSWPRNLVFDLAGQLTPSEILLVQDLSKNSEVEVLYPKAEALQGFDSMRETYSLLLGETSSHEKPIKTNVNLTSTLINPQQVRKFSTMLAEVKDVCGEIRQWADEGAPLEKIAIVSPDIEVYWPFIYSYLKKEGISVQKKWLTRAHSLPSVSVWLSRLRLELQSISTNDLETLIYSEVDLLPIIKFEDFKKIFTNIYDSNDLGRSSQLKSLFNFKVRAEDQVEIHEYLAWATRYWGAPEFLESLESLVKALINDVRPHLKMRLLDWNKYLTSVASKMEVSTGPSPASGVFCEKISSARYLDVDKIYIVGLTQNNITQSSKTAISSEDVRNLRQDLGFYLNNPDHNVEEEELNWLMQGDTFERVLSTSVTNFSGQAETSAVYWVECALVAGKDPEEVDQPKMTMWDYQQQLGVGEIGLNLFADSYKSDLVRQFIERDRGEIEFDKFNPDELKSLSVSSLKNYAKCPFIFCASKLFSLTDLPAVDVDVDRMSKGTFNHSLYEYLTVEPMRFDYTDQELFNIVEECRVKKKVMLGSPGHWDIVAEKYVVLCKNFLSFEKKWREQFPKTQTIGREILVAADWSLSDNTFVASGSGDIAFRGFIDRIDSDREGHAVVIDYKSSRGQTSNYKAWLKDNELQMAVYSYLLKQGYGDLEKLDVWAACYYVMKSFERSSGFWRNDVPSNLYSLESRAKNRLTESELDNFYGQILSSLGQLIQNVLDGDFAPVPKEKKDCPKCHWRKMCRAPHLN